MKPFLETEMPGAPVFSMPTRHVLPKVLRADLVAAGIPYRNSAGRVADFHSLRHTFITNLANGGVHPKVAQALARHCSITLTMDRYSHTYHEEQAEALRVLPVIDEEVADELSATGTIDA